MTDARRLAPLLLAALAAPALAADAVDAKRILEHIRKRFSTPPELKMQLKELVPSPIPGLVQGTLEFNRNGAPSRQEIHITADGRYYLLAPRYENRPSDIPGLLAPAGEPGKPPAPPIYLSPDGKHVLSSVFGPPQDTSVDPDKDAVSKMRLKGGLSRGPENAPVTVVEFSDLQCPHCRHAHEALEANLAKKYGDKVRWISKHYPLQNSHPWAYDAAIAVSCAERLKANAYQALQSDFFSAQKDIGPKNLREKTLGFAKKAGLDPEAFARCFDKKETKEQVDADIAEGDVLGVSSTPTVFVNGRRSPNPADFAALSVLIDEMLAAK